MPKLEETLGPGFALALARTAELCRADADFLDSLAEFDAVDMDKKMVSVEHLSSLHPSLRHRIILRWLRSIGADQVNRDHILSVDSLISDWHGQISISVPGGTVTREGGYLRLHNL